MPVGTRLDDWLSLIRGEFQKVPDLRVTLEQAAVLWNLEPRDLELITGHVRRRRVPPALAERVVLPATARRRDRGHGSFLHGC